MEITNEIKAKVFAQYLRQKVSLPNNYNFSGIQTTSKSAELRGINTDYISFMGIPAFYPVSDFQLILKPLSAITDEHIIWVYDTSHNLHEQRKLNPDWVKSVTPSLKEMKEQINIRGFAFSTGGWLCNTWNYQYLLSKGYDLEQFLLGYKTLQESGLAIYEN